MNELDLLYLKDLAFEHLSKDARDMIQANLKIHRKVGAKAYMAFIRWERTGLHLRATEAAANDLLFLVATHPAFTEGDFIDGNSEITNEQREKEIIDAVFALSDVAGITPPDWLVRKPSAEAQTLKEENQHLRQEIERLEAENKGMRKADDHRQIRNMAKAIYGIAVDKYGYDPDLKRNTATSVMSAAAEKRGVKTTRGTIKRYIDKGKQYLDEDGK